MDNPQLIADTVITLTPALPFLLKVGEGAAKKIGENAVATVADSAKKIWAWLQPHAQAGSPLLLAAEVVAKDPNDSDNQGALRKEIRKLLEAQPHLVQELSGVMSQIHVSGKGNIVAGGPQHIGTLNMTNH
jgi:ketosteroid isomerase-like protein